MSDTKIHQRMYRERQGEIIKDGAEFQRYGNRRKEIARLKVKDRRRERKVENYLTRKQID